MPRRAATTALFVCLAAQGATGFRLEPLAGGFYSGDGGPAVSAPLASVQGIAVSSQGDIYFADAADHRIRRIDSRGTISTIAGDGRAGFSGDGGPAAKARLHAPYGVALAPDGSLYFADLGNGRVRRIAPDGEISTFAGGGGEPPGLTPIFATEANLRGPRNLLLLPGGDLLITDFYAHRLYRVAANGWMATATDGELRNPAGLARDGAGAVYVADSGSRRILRLWGGLLTPLSGTSGALAFKLPTGVALDREGRYHVADNEDPAWFPAGAPVRAHAAQETAAGPDGTIYLARGGFLYRLDKDNLLRHVAGSGDWGTRGDGGPPLEAHLQAPAALAVGRGGMLYIADAQASRVRRSEAGGPLATVAGDPVLSPLRSPRGLAVHPQTGEIYVADTGNNRIQVYAATGEQRTLMQAKRPEKMAFDGRRGFLYLCEAGAGRVLQQLPMGNWRVLAEGLDNPRGVAVDADGTVFVAEGGANRVLRIAADGTRESTPARAPLAVAVSAGSLFIAEEGFPGILELPAAAAPKRHGAEVLEAPQDILALEDGTLVAADAGSRQVWRLTRDALPPAQVESARLRVLHAATGEEGPFAPGQRILLPDAPEGELRINGEHQANPVLPENLQPGSAAVVEVVRDRQTAAGATIEIVETAPGLFHENGVLRAVNGDGSINSAAEPASRGSEISFYATGLGLPNNLPVSVRIAGLPAELLYLGPSSFAGVLQINVRVPVGFFGSGAQPVTVNVGTAATQAGVRVFVR
ncbi:MAG: SMP-30/gluconolactonase/LRE family protein [Bryobacteraceae bacterium]|nr:SMP-30/gluconolactonase/LRE family protein [Bryobacteraceae bacterium]